MHRSFLLIEISALFLSASLPAAAQSFQPKTIQFLGASEYSLQDLLSASGLKPDAVLTAAAMDDCSKVLLATGLFSNLTYKFDGKDLVFQLKPSEQLYPIRFENLPIALDKDLEGELHERFPLYHGKVPSDGGLLESVRGALEELLAAQGIKATVMAAPFTDLSTRKVTAMSFSITAPPVVVGEIHPDSSSAALDPKALDVLAKISGSAYDREGSSSKIVIDVGNLYREKGYLEAEIHATQQAAAAVAPDAIRIPFSMSVSPGQLYKIKTIQLAPDMVVTQAEFDKQSGIHPGDIANGEHVRQNWQFIERQYHNRGYMKARVQPVASFDRDHGMVSYAVAAEPGPQYTMGSVSVENVSDDLRSMMLAAWKLSAGAPFNEGAVRGYFATHDVNPNLERIFAAVNCKYVLKLNDATKTVDVVLRLEKRP